MKSAGLDFIPDNREDLDKLYCSELAAAGYEKTKPKIRQTRIDDKILKNFLEKLLINSKPSPIKFSNTIDKYFWTLS